MGTLRFPCTYRDRDYWLCRCQGFDVYRHGRRLGRVAELRFRSRLDRPDALIVRGGLPRAHPTVVAVGEVDSIDPNRRRLVLHETAGIPGPVGASAESIPAGRERGVGGRSWRDSFWRWRRAPKSTAR